MSDGECNEGTVWEAAMFAAHHALDNLTVVVDKNDFQGFGATSEVIKMGSIAKKFEAFGWHAAETDGHDVSKLLETFDGLPTDQGKPMVVIAQTVKGKGVAGLEDTLASHYSSLNEEQHRLAVEALAC
jgi:transketolase